MVLLPLLRPRPRQKLLPRHHLPRLLQQSLCLPRKTKPPVRPVFPKLHHPHRHLLRCRNLLRVLNLPPANSSPPYTHFLSPPITTPPIRRWEQQPEPSTSPATKGKLIWETVLKLGRRPPLTGLEVFFGIVLPGVQDRRRSEVVLK